MIDADHFAGKIPDKNRFAAAGVDDAHIDAHARAGISGIVEGNPGALPGGIRLVEFEGPYPVGLPGTHIHALANPSVEQPVFHLPARAVIDLGQWLLGQSSLLNREICVTAGGAHGRYEVPIGSPIADLLTHAGIEDDAASRILIGSAIDGRRVSSGEGFIGPDDELVTVLTEPAITEPPPRLRFAIDRTSLLGRLMHRGQPGHTTAMHGEFRHMIPAEAIERVWPHHVPPLPLLRALLTEDDDTAIDLGALAFVEEDMALASWACPAKYDYGQALRAFLDRMQTS